MFLTAAIKRIYINGKCVNDDICNRASLFLFTVPITVKPNIVVLQYLLSTILSNRHRLYSILKTI